MENGGVLLARWTTDWDCGYETEWWYCIKDRPFDICALKSKRRYEINKGNKNFEVREIDPTEYSEDLFKITSATYETYPASYRPKIEHDSFVEETKKWSFYKTYGAFLIEDGTLYGYACLLKSGSYINFRNLKAAPNKEKLGINAAIVNKILEDHENFLENGGYICDGARSVQHETAFQNYLEKYFDFRKAYCVLHVAFKLSFTRLIRVVYPFRKVLKHMGKIKAVRKINTFLRMEEIRRTFE